ncbi:acetyl-CoA carboxylase biotin carboxyl carrier protein subunit [Coprobacter sp.]|uniref:acetyl-CoA carboxylase biotin carboxyl carrier protein subunit n=1 Tax=Coprobacter sp. TaxID=1941478 RepID=UPI003AB37B6F
MEIRVGNRIADIELISKDGNAVKISIDGKVLDVDVVMAENGVCSILMDGISYNAELIRAEGGKNYTVNTLFASLGVEILDAKAKLLSARKKDGEKQTDRIISLMPGKVVRMMVAAGDRLSAGDTVLVIEAMKMQSNFKVSEDCVVREVLVKEGDLVNSDQVLVWLNLNDLD